MGLLKNVRAGVYCILKRSLLPPSFKLPSTLLGGRALRGKGKGVKGRRGLRGKEVEISLIGTEKGSTGYEKVLAAVNAIKQAGARTEGSRRG